MKRGKLTSGAEEHVHTGKENRDQGAKEPDTEGVDRHRGVVDVGHGGADFGIGRVIVKIAGGESETGWMKGRG
jgi:hypothetical protein